MEGYNAAMDCSLSTALDLNGSLELEVASGAKQLVLLLGEVSAPIEVKQLNAKGEVVATDRVTSPYTQLDKVSPQVTKLLISGNGTIYEVITR